MMTRPTCSSQRQSSLRSMIPPRKSLTNFHRRRGRSVLSMLVQREISPKGKFVQRKQRWSKTRFCTMKQTRQSLLSWVEAESLQHLSAKYCPFEHSPRSTIAASFSSDGKTLASTHGDHTVKIIDFQTGNCLKVLSGHHRTPWVVRFHPLDSEIVASGSLDQNVRLWNVTTSECIKSHDFDKPVASMAFHAEGELLAVVSGHKLHMWHYNRSGEESKPVVVLKTRRSLRAVHFHPHGAPFLMTAEASEIDPLDSSMSIATSVGYLRHPPPAIVFTGPESSRESDRVSWELPFIQGWLMAQGHGGVSAPPNTGSSASRSSAPSLEAGVALTELPCTVKLRVWRHDMGDPFALMKPDSCLLTIPHVVLCSEMGAHLSPCGRYLAACVACVPPPHAEMDPGLQTLAQQDSGLATSPTQHPVTAHQFIYELRVYSLQKESYGSVLVSREIRAAHCLTSIQFSPTSDHILLAYGRHHGSLLNSIVNDGEATSHFFTVLEIYRVSDMELVRVLPSSEDEVNVACFHPSPGAGLVYGTKEGSLRIFQSNTGATSNLTGPNTFPEENLSEVA
ncbi:WD_REPEATS_REGION domain-containing protein [Hirschfeldia incana]|nr:WD_REPEATS_REGION domain-containing protein [Hirschfeldia incana]